MKSFYRLNQQRVTNQRHNSQVTSILSKLTNSHYYSSTIGRLSAAADDTSDPDIYSNENAGVKLRQSWFCLEDDSDEKKAPVVHLSGPLYSTISSNPWPLPSEIDIYVSITRNKNEILVTHTGGEDILFRIVLEYIELTVPRIIVDPVLQSSIDKQWAKKPIELVYNRLETRSFVLGPGRLNFDSGSLFQGYDIPPIFLAFFQSQKRVGGDFHKSIHKFEIPGGEDNLIDLDFYIDQERFGRYRSSKQTTVETGSLMRHYRETLVNINALQSSNTIPPFYFDDYKKWNFINGIYMFINIKNILKLINLAFRTTPVETSLNYIDQIPHIKIPVS